MSYYDRNLKFSAKLTIFPVPRKKILIMSPISHTIHHRLPTSRLPTTAKYQKRCADPSRHTAVWELSVVSVLRIDDACGSKDSSGIAQTYHHRKRTVEVEFNTRCCDNVAIVSYRCNFRATFINIQGYLLTNGS